MNTQQERLDEIVRIVRQRAADVVRLPRGLRREANLSAFIAAMVERSEPEDVAVATDLAEKINLMTVDLVAQMENLSGDVLCKRRSNNPSVKRPIFGCAGVKVRQQIAFCLFGGRRRDEGRGVIWTGSPCGAD